MAKRMYIFICDDVDLGHALLTAAHGAVACTVKYQDHPDTQEWLKGQFRKVVCKVNRVEFERIKTLSDDFLVMNECGIEGNPEISIVFRPREEFPKAFSFFKLYR
jgi:peptidyl-tRNA hydrolase